MHWSTRHVGTLLVVLLVALAGCGGSGGSPTPTPADGGGNATATATGTEAPSPTATETATATATATETATAAGTTTATTTRTPTEGQIRTLTVVGSHLDALREAGTYRVRYEVEIVRANTTTVSGTAVRNLETGAFLQTRRSGFVNATLYRPGGSDTVYICRFVDGECPRQRTVPAARSDALNFSTPTLGNMNITSLPEFEDAGLVDTEDGQRRKYVVDDLEQFPFGFGAGEGGSGDVSSFNMSVLVDPQRGLITDYSFSVTRESGGTEQTTRIRVEYVQVGNVDVSAPDWYEGDE